MKQSTINLLTSIKNHTSLKRESLQQNFYSNSYQILKILYKEGFVQSIEIKQNKANNTKRLKLIFRFFFNRPIIKKLNFFSKPAIKTSIRSKQLKMLSLKKAVLIISTSRGLLTNTQCVKKNIGGKLLFSVQ
jgi:ribosomal protein S8